LLKVLEDYKGGGGTLSSGRGNLLGAAGTGFIGGEDQRQKVDLVD